MQVLLCLVLTLLPLAVTAVDELSPQQLEEWFQDDDRLQPLDKKSDEGALVFLKSAPTKRTPHSRNILTIPAQAVRSGWVEIDQCHDQLDPIAAVEIVYQYKKMRGLRITRKSGIGKAWVNGQSIQLQDVGKGARLCMQAEAQILYKQSNGRFVLRNGPFQRRFLDSFFPMHVTLTVRYPGHLLALTSISPPSQAGFKVLQENGSLHIDSWFEGKLTIEIEFRQVI